MPPQKPSNASNSSKSSKPSKASKPRTSANLGAASKVPGGGKPIPAYQSVPATTNPRQASQRVLQTILINRKQAYDYTTRVGQDRVVQLLKQSSKDLERRLKRVNPNLLKEGAFTPTAMRATMGQIEDLMKQLMLPGMRSSVVDAKRIAIALGKVDGLKNLVAMDARFAGVASTARLGVAMQLDPKAKGVDSSVLRRLATQYPDVKPGAGILERYGMNVVGKFEDRLRVAVVTGKPWNEVREDLIDESTWLQDSPLYWAQRIVRTETQGAYNRSLLDQGIETQEILGGDMVKILVAGFDDRTAWDSYQVHGQIRRLEEPFEYNMKDGTTVAYMNPPNRPNDREAIVFHRMEWPIPESLEPMSDDEYEARFMEQNPKGSPPARPNMSTVDLSLFGKEVA